MEREIKFRAWDIKREIMLDHFWLFTLVYGYDDGHHFHQDDCCLGGFPESENLIVMQYTGIKDKNGKEIYEGDIVMYNVDASSPERGLYTTQYKEAVYFNQEWLRFDVDDGCGGEPLHTIENVHGVEVIGNIYENPELLTK